MIEKKSWSEFRDAKMLWWINRILHTFGWAIVVVMDKDGTIREVYPARVSFRGFNEESEQDGYMGVTKWLADNANDLYKEII